MAHIDTWIIHKTKKVLVTDLPGPPRDVVFIIDLEDYKQKGPTVYNLGFDREVYKGFDEDQEAIDYARTKAEELGYEVQFDWYNFPDYSDDDDEEDYWEDDTYDLLDIDWELDYDIDEDTL